MRHLYTGKEKDAHVSQIARMRLDAVVAPETPQINVTDEAWWAKLKVGKFVLFWNRSNPPVHLTMMEVINCDETSKEFFGWFNCHRVPCAKYKHDRPLTQMRYGTYAPEWVDKRGQSWIAPNEN